ncbi:hypothetical protein [Neptunomonas japonica]|uniref:hypothetical protein n=1 Tax=Neptunomonas japonica TaxID=417574 RepID=UPI000417B21D|nr:hypothetical protein [Neptunomonas japonica]
MHSFFIQQRSIPAKRWLSIGLRCMHLVGICGLSGAYLFSLPQAEWHGYLLITLVSGGLMVLKEIYLDTIWLLQLRGQVILLKVALFGLAAVFSPKVDPLIFIIIIVVSGIIAHAPGKLRYYSLWHRGVITHETLVNADIDNSDK